MCASKIFYVPTGPAHLTMCHRLCIGTEFSSLTPWLDEARPYFWTLPPPLSLEDCFLKDERLISSITCWQNSRRIYRSLKLSLTAASGRLLQNQHKNPLTTVFLLVFVAVHFFLMSSTACRQIIWSWRSLFTCTWWTTPKASQTWPLWRSTPLSRYLTFMQRKAFNSLDCSDSFMPSKYKPP